MKNLTIATSLIISLLTSQAVMASQSVSVTVDENVEIITVVAQPDPTDFAVFSLRHAEEAMNEAMDYVADSLVAADDVPGINELAVNTGS